ncbi:hypothetical protein QFC24_005644 [Naganishia onofrii]|uniref:Uncharacterized protein n=1 Tax=Naganishia onofrii TaxID=1851511 RepID=A0ACC2X8M7_9TREE|nr:hypothetical protein QFC24_005644 [Naganishia onofrii]
MSGRPKGSKNKDINLNRVEYDKPDATFRGWNFRYFGQYTVAEDSIDPDDPIFPRNVTRIGNRYQAVVPTWEEQQAIELERAQEPITADLPVRGHDQGGPGRAPTVIWKSKPDPNRESDIGTKVAIPLKTDIDYRKVPEFMTSIRQLKLPVPVFSAEAYDKTLMIFLVRGAKAALNVFADAKLADYYRPLKHFTGEDLEKFEAQVAKFGSLEAHSTAKLLRKNVWEVVRFYYVWKNELLGQQHAAERAAKEHQSGAVRAVKAIKAKVSTKHQLATTALPTGASVVMGHFQRESTSESDAEGSIWEADEIPREAKPTCAICGNKKVDSWYKAPRSQSGPYLCNWCGLSFRKYGVAIPYKGTLDDTNKKVDKREGTPLDGPTLKKLKVAAAVAAVSKPVTPPPPPPPPPRVVPCCLCLKLEPRIMARCKNCTFAIHPGKSPYSERMRHESDAHSLAGCYGIPAADVNVDWLCEPCNNEKNLDASLVCLTDDGAGSSTDKQTFRYQDIICVLCPRKLPKLVRPIKIRPKVMPDFDFLDALKTTEGYKWAHILCSIFVPDITYADASRLKVAEGIMSINQQARFRGTCTICHKTGDGAVIEFGFELTAPPTALRKYALTYRASPSSAESFGLLRKAQRIEAYLTKAKEEKKLGSAKDDIKPIPAQIISRLNTPKEDTTGSFAVKKETRPASVKDARPDSKHTSQTITV